MHDNQVTITQHAILVLHRESQYMSYKYIGLWIWNYMGLQLKRESRWLSCNKATSSGPKAYKVATGD